MTPSAALTLFVVALGAFAAPILARRVHLPTAVGEIFFGIAIGRGGFGLVGDPAAVELFALLGFLFLMFLAGLEIDFGTFEASPSVRRRAAAGTAAIVLAAWGASLLVGRGPLIALLLGAVSIGILVPTLREAGTLKTPVGQTLLALGTFGEIAMLAGLTLYEAWAAHGVSIHLGAGILRLALIVGAGALILRFLVLAAWWEPERFAPLADPDDPSEVGVRGALALLFVLVALAAWLGVEPIVGAFLAGALLGYVFRAIRTLEAKIAGTAFGFFIPVFFIHVGMRFDPRGLFAPEIVFPAAILAVGILTVRLVAIPALWGVAGWREAVGGALLLGAPLTLLVATAEVARRHGRIGDAEESSLVLAAILTAVLFPAAFRRITAPRRPPAQRPPLAAKP